MPETLGICTSKWFGNNSYDISRYQQYDWTCPMKLQKNYNVDIFKLV